MVKRISRNSILTDYVRYHFENPKELNSLKPQTRAKLFFDQREKMRDALEYLTFMLEHLPEKQLRKTFTLRATDKNGKDAGWSSLALFLKVLFSPQGKDVSRDRKRLLELWNFILTNLASDKSVSSLATPEQRRLLQWYNTGGEKLKTLYALTMAEE